MCHRVASGLLAVFLVVSLGLAYGQITNVTNDTMTPIEGVGHDYIKMMSETVNPANGGLNIHIDMPVAKSRGLTVPFSITYDSNNVHHLNANTAPSYGSSGWQANSSLLGKGGWTFALPYARLSTWYENVAVLTGYGGNGPIYTVYHCGNASNYVMLDLSGVTHSLAVGARSGVASGDPSNLCGAGSAAGSDKKVYSFLGSWGGAIGQPPTLTVNDDVGTVYKYSAFKPDNTLDPSSYAALPASIEDRNGNIATFAINASNAVTVTDSSGRTSISTSGFGPSGSTNNVTVSGELFQVTWRLVSASFPTQSQWAGQSGGPVGYTCNPPPAASDSQTVISQIKLPNGKFYKFYYGSDITPHSASANSYGLLSEIDYPSGAWVTYSWKLSDTLNELADYPGLYFQTCDVCGACDGGTGACPAPVPDGCRYQYKTPVVAARQVSFGGTSPVLTQTFVYSTTWGSSPPLSGWANKSTTTTTTDNARGQTASTTYSYRSLTVGLPPFAGGSGAINPQVAVEQTVTYSDWDGSPLRTITKDWQDQFDIILDQATITTPGGGGLTSKKTYTYVTNSSIKEPLEADEFDFGANSATRMTVTNYQSFSGANGTIAAAPCQVLVCSAGSSCTAAASNKVAETDYLYDGGTAACGASGSAATSEVNGLVSGTHDDTLYAPTSTTPRANVTKVIRSLTGGTSPATTYSYDKTGHIVSSTDACGNGSCADMTGTSHTTTYLYADAFTILSGGTNISYTPANGAANSYLTQVTDAAGHVSKFTYDYSNGQLTSSKDQNDINASGPGSTYIYNDLMARPTQVAKPDGGQTSVAYNDTAPSPTVTTCELINGTAGAVCDPANPPSGWKTTLVTKDGMGHVIQTKLVSDPDGATYTVTSYDGLGKPYQVWSPTRCSTPTTNCGESTWGITTYTYEALGRTINVGEPDGSSTSMKYDGSSTSNVGTLTTVTDEAGNQRTTMTDAMGRLTAVWEAPNVGGFNYETDYQYDALNNLICAVQKGTSTATFTNCASSPASWRPRSFFYDSLSRLSSASNPESGTIGYTYDLNGNLSTKTSPLPNQPPPSSATVTTNYTYDALNRLTKKTYTGMTSPPMTTVQYGYDAVVLAGCASSPPTFNPPDSYPTGRRTSMCDGSGATSWKHDPMGRILQEKRKLGPTGIPTTTYAYNLDGSLASVTDPLTAKLITYQPGGAGRPLNAINGTLNYVTSATYAPFGGLSGMVNGQATGFAGINTADTYNNRLQPLQLYVTTGTISSSTLTQLQSLPCPTTVASIMSRSYNFAAGATPGDNGNVQSITNCRDTTRNQLFTYDALNRIKKGNSSGSGATSWGETYTIDAWGNLKQRDPVTGKAYYEPLLCTVSNSNQLGACSFTYDIAGNLIQNATVPYVYDAENRLTWTGGFSYLYDGDGNRVEKCTSTQAQAGTCPSGATGTLYWRGIDGDTLVESDISPTNLQNEYIFFNGKRVARRDSTSHVHYYFSDHLGTHSVVENATGSVCEQDIDYYPYGGAENDYCSGTSVAQNYKFTGKERDTESGLDNFGARYDASTLGRFMTPDSLAYSDLHDPQSLNLYSYVGNNPTNLIDPDGHCWKVAQWFCDAARNTGQRFNNLFSGDGFHTNKGVEDIAHRNNARNRQREVNPPSLPSREDLIKQARETDKNLNDFTNKLLCEMFCGLFGDRASPRLTPRTGVVVFRVWGNKSGPWGKSWTRVDPRTVPNYRDAAGLPNTNSGRFVTNGELPSLDGVNQTTARPLDGNAGGLDELEIQNPEEQITDWTIEVLPEGVP